MKTRVIALYLPQYHPTPSNDKWWGKGFTEWTNVGKAKKYFIGHEQPKVPADLGYYDLRLPESREAQAILAKEAGVEAFCYYHYWFGNGHQELDIPFKETLQSGRPNFPFCLCWANETWYSKFWNMDGTVSKTPIAEQLYPGDEDIVNHFYSLLPAFKDKRYLKVNGKLFFMIYKPLDYPLVTHFMKLWNDLARENGLDGFYFVGHLVNGKDINSANVDKLISLGFNSVNVAGLFRAISKDRKFIDRVIHKVFNRPYLLKYSAALKDMITEEDNRPEVIPTITPNWDHSPRSGASGVVLTGSSGDLFKELVRKALYIVKDRREEERIIILKAWNEWGEGNYMEPDLKYGKMYINALNDVLNEDI